MRILHVAYIYPPILNVADGITNVIYNVTKELYEKGHKVTVYTSNLLDLHNNKVLCTDNLIVNGVIVYYLRFLWRYKTFIITPSIILLLHKHIKDFDIIHIHDCRSFQGIISYFFAKRKKIPYIFQPHGSFLSSRPQSSSIKIIEFVLDKLVSEKIVKNASKIITLSQVEDEQYRAIGVPEKKIAIIPNGIDISKYAKLPPKGLFKKKLDISEDKRIILYLGRIHKTKGLDFLLNAYAYYVKNIKYNDTILVISGPDDGNLFEIKQLITSLGIINKVIFTGMISEKEKINAFVDSSIVVNVEPKNVFGLVPLEAAACSTPVIVSKGNAINNIIKQGQFGFSVEYGDVSDLSKKMNKLIYDDALREEMGRKGREFVFNNFSWNSIITRLEKVYEEVISG